MSIKYLAGCAAMANIFCIFCIYFNIALAVKFPSTRLLNLNVTDDSSWTETVLPFQVIAKTELCTLNHFGLEISSSGKIILKVKE